MGVDVDVHSGGRLGGRAADRRHPTTSTRNAIVASYARPGAEVCGADQSDPRQAARVFWAICAGCVHRRCRGW